MGIEEAPDSTSGTPPPLSVNKENIQDIVASLIPSLKRELREAPWWTDVNDGVKHRLEFVVDNIWYVGVLFKQAFFNLFLLEANRRYINNETCHSNSIASYMAAQLNLAVSEEAYRCGVIPTRAALGLCDGETADESIKPYDADVMSCMFLCNKIELLEKASLLSANTSYISPQSIFECFHSVSYSKSTQK